MDLDIVGCCSKCICSGPGHCPCYGFTMSERLHSKCKSSQVWRDNFSNFFEGVKTEEYRAEAAVREKEATERAARQLAERKARERGLDEAMAEIEDRAQGSDMSGLGDLIEGVLTKFGVTSEKVEKALGVPSCGCSKRKQFLNELFPFARKNDEKKKEIDPE